MYSQGCWVVAGKAASWSQGTLPHTSCSTSTVRQANKWLARQLTSHLTASYFLQSCQECKIGKVKKGFIDFSQCIYWYIFTTNLPTPTKKGGIGNKVMTFFGTLLDLCHVYIKKEISTSNAIVKFGTSDEQKCRCSRLLCSCYKLCSRSSLNNESLRLDNTCKCRCRACKGDHSRRDTKITKSLYE